MVIDSSAIISILLMEPEADRLARAISSDPRRLLAAVTHLECAIVIQAKRGAQGVQSFDALLHRVAIETVGMDADQVALARRAYERFGKGRNKAGLNLGDCCAYALSRYSGEPLLYKGGDFAETDVQGVRY